MTYRQFIMKEAITMRLTYNITMNTLTRTQPLLKTNKLKEGNG